jgi:hypothetical protein
VKRLALSFSLLCASMPALAGDALSQDQINRIRSLLESSPTETVRFEEGAFEDAAAQMRAASRGVVDVALDEPHEVSGRTFYAERWDRVNDRLAEGDNGILVESPDYNSLRFRQVVPMIASPDQIGGDRAEEIGLRFAERRGLLPDDASDLFDVRSNAVAATNAVSGDQGVVFHTVYLLRAIDGVPVYNSNVKVRVSPEGGVIGAYNNNWLALSDDTIEGAQRPAGDIVREIERAIDERAAAGDVVRASPPQLYWHASAEEVTPVIFTAVTVTRDTGDAPAKAAFEVVVPVLEGVEIKPLGPEAFGAPAPDAELIPAAPGSDER